MRKIIRVLSVAVAPIVSVLTFLSGCFNLNSRRVEIDNGGIMQDLNLPPEQDAAYEAYTNNVLDEYRRIAQQHLVDGDVDFENEEVIAAANVASAKLFAYACYNERTLDKYVFFSDQTGVTDLGSTGAATARKQEYYLRVNESAKTYGYRYHYTIKKVIESSGAIGAMKGFFESARIRMTDKTNLLYRFEGDMTTFALSDDVHETLGCNLLEGDWKTGSDWGKADIQMVKSDFIQPESIEADIVAHAGEDNITIRGNINILADGIVKYSTITEDGEGGYTVVMSIDTDVANTDEASLKMLRKANSSDNCEWVADGDDTGLTIVFRLWNNGLLRWYSIEERWSGKISGFSGTAQSYTSFYYSYFDADCDMTANLEMLENAKTAVES